MMATSGKQPILRGFTNTKKELFNFATYQPQSTQMLHDIPTVYISFETDDRQYNLKLHFYKLQ